MTANVNKTKILKYVDGIDPVKGGFLNVAELMQDVVKKMVDGGGFVVKHCSVTDTILNTVPWGVIDGTGTWAPSPYAPQVGAPPGGAHTEGSISVLNSVSGGPMASITLEAGGPGVITGGGSTPPTQATWIDYLNPNTNPWTVPDAIVTFVAVIIPNTEDSGATGIMTVSGAVTGTIKVGMSIKGVGVTTGTTITALINGTGAAGTYKVSVGQTVPAMGSDPVAITATASTTHALVNEAWRVRFELYNYECVAAYVGTPLQLPGWLDATTSPKVPEPWGIPGTVSKLTDPRGVVVDCAGAVGARQWIPSCYTISGVAMGSTAVGGTNTIVSINTDGTCTMSKAATFTKGTSFTLTNKQVTGGGLVYGTTYYVMTAVSPASTTVQITDTYANAVSSTPAVFTAGAVSGGTVAIDSSPSTGTGYAAGDVVYIKDPIFSSTLGYSGAVFFRIDSVNDTGGVLALSIMDGGRLVQKSVITDPEKTRAPAAPGLGMAVTGNYYNFNTYLPGTGTGLGLLLTVSNSVANVGPGSGGHVDEIDAYQGFYNRGQRVGTNGASYPLKYQLSISNNGFFLGIYESNWATSVGGAGTIAKFTAAITKGTVGSTTSQYPPPVLIAQNVLGTITPGMLLQGDSRIAGGTRILDYPDPAVITDPLAGKGDSGRYILSANPSVNVGYYNTTTGLVQGDLPGGRTVRNPPITLTGYSGDSRFNWMLVQRPVNRTTGVILDNYDSITSKHPVFCLNSVGGRYYHFTVREKDISHPQEGPSDHASIAYYNGFAQYPTPGDYDNYPYRVPSGLNSEDSHLLFNPQNQISLTEDRTYLITFPNNLTTPRFRYTEEIDMIGFTSSDILMSSQEITFNTYGEAQDRVYVALPPSGRYNTGVRFCVLKQTGNT